VIIIPSFNATGYLKDFIKLMEGLPNFLGNKKVAYLLSG